MYLLEFDDRTAQKYNAAPAMDYRLSLCLPSCEDFAYNYVSNPNTMRCEYCGETCTHCTLQYGCSDCYGTGGRQHSAATGYLEHIKTDPKTEEKTALFPFRYHGRTAHGGPSSEFRTCVDCKTVDPRCDVCENHSKRTKKPTRPFPSTAAAGQAWCDRCPEHVQSAAI